MFYREGISQEMDVLDLAEKYGIVQKSSAWYSYGGERLGQGRENVRKFLKKHPKVVAELAQK